MKTSLILQLIFAGDEIGHHPSLSSPRSDTTSNQRALHYLHLFFKTKERIHCILCAEDFLIVAFAKFLQYKHTSRSGISL
mmetsp:Transcript_11976/g.16569  ORF Transcript_11976/g.16569 Transcript_11976/m.16569 type:complete len:80 (-) Transcript_11976:845-1084(-)